MSILHFLKKYGSASSSKVILSSLILIFSILIMITEITISNKHVENSLFQAINSVERSTDGMFKNSEYALLEIIQEFESVPHSVNHMNKSIKRIRGLRYQFNRIPWTEFSWINSRNNIVADSKLGVIKSNNKINLSHRDYVQKAIRQPYTLQIGSKVVGSTSYKRMIPFGIATTRNEKYSGAIVLGVEIAKIAKIIKDSTPKNTIAIILGVNNEFLLSSDESFFLKEKTINKEYLEKISELEDFKSSQLDTNFFIHKDIKGAFRKSQKYPFTYIAIYQDLKNQAKLSSKYSIRIKILILILLSVILLMLAIRFNKLY